MKKDTKILIKFIALMAAAVALGAVLGIASTVYNRSFSQLMTMLMDKVTYASHILVYAAGFVLVLAFSDYTKGKKSVAVALSTDDETAYEKADTLLETSLEKITYTIILGYTAFGAMVSGFCGLYTMADFGTVIPAVAMFFVIIFGTTFLQSAVVKQVKLLNPEKQGNVLDTRFTQEWLANCDEAEIALIGKAAYASYQSTQKALAFAFLVAVAASFVLPLGPLPVMLIGAVWFVQAYTYMRHARNHGKNK